MKYVERKMFGVCISVLSYREIITGNYGLENNYSFLKFYNKIGDYIYVFNLASSIFLSFTKMVIATCT